MTAPSLHKWTHPRTGEIRYYIDNWHALCGIHTDRYHTGNIRAATIDDYDGDVSNSKAARTCEGRVWLDTAGSIHLDHHHPGSLLSEAEKHARIQASLDQEDTPS